MTNNQKNQFNQMRTALPNIMNYQSPTQLQKNAEKEYGLSGTEAIEMAYDNIKTEASLAVKGIKEIK